MQLTLYTDYSLRTLIYLGTVRRASTITEIAESYGISRNHLVKVVHQLGKHGYIVTERGRGGGISLAREPEQINLGEVVRHMEPNFHLVQCFNPDTDQCVISPNCALKRVLSEAQRSFMKVLEGYSLADVVHKQRPALAKLLGAVI